jgi:hypothetical protein
VCGQAHQGHRHLPIAPSKVNSAEGDAGCKFSDKESKDARKQMAVHNADSNTTTNQQRDQQKLAVVVTAIVTAAAATTRAT